jgi:hypothetical protein
MLGQLLYITLLDYVSAGTVDDGHSAHHSELLQPGEQHVQNN